MKKIKAVIIGAGDRGFTYADYALKYPLELEIVGVAEPKKDQREKFSKAHKIPKKNQFKDYKEIFKKKRFADLAIITTVDQMHVEPTLLAFKNKYNVLLEKPMASTPKECALLHKEAKKARVFFEICYVLRYSPLFKTIKEIIKSGKIGEIQSIHHIENVHVRHYAHSYVRGNWGNEKESAPMLLAKSCHDIDLFLWLLDDTKAQYVSSFGSLSYYKRKNAPKDSTERCLDGCPKEQDCPFSTKKIYFNEDDKEFTNYLPIAKKNEENVIKLLENSQYGKCVFKCDNDVVDHQVVNLEMTNGATVSFSMCGFASQRTRIMRIAGTKGEIVGDLRKNRIKILYHLDNTCEKIIPGVLPGEHGGGDTGLIRDILFKLRDNQKSSDSFLNSHLICFAAEESRKNKKVIDYKEYRKRYYR
ncbi:MAG: gfo/Idh/MocA family oxidoreductase [Candidatus Moranbacteria bacterium]|nr:gfo/Idh/MocA family oxidoreductase [Candidatus Moranbacteria bacterium]